MVLRINVRDGASDVLCEWLSESIWRQRWDKKENTEREIEWHHTFFGGLSLLLILIFSMANWFVRSKMRALAGNSLGKLMRCRKRGMRRRDSLTILLETLMFIFNHVFFHNRHHNFMIIIHDVLGRRPRRPFLWKHLWERRSQTHRGGGAGKSQGRNSITCIPILPPGDRTWFPFEQYLSLVGVLADHHQGNISGSEDKPIKVKSSRNA